jgi:hypothetical protein
MRFLQTVSKDGMGSRCLTKDWRSARPIRSIFLIAFLISYISSLGAQSALALTMEEERKLGDQVVQEVAAKFTLIQDSVLLG